MANLSGAWEGVRSIDSIGKANRRAIFIEKDTTSIRAMSRRLDLLSNYDLPRE